MPVGCSEASLSFERGLGPPQCARSGISVEPWPRKNGEEPWRRGKVLQAGELVDGEALRTGRRVDDKPLGSFPNFVESQKVLKDIG